VTRWGTRSRLIDALPAVLARQRGTKVMIIGRVYYDAFVKRAAELGVSDALIVTGAISPDQVPAYFAAADLVAHDLQGGGCGTASLEAMAAGKATVATVRETNFPGVELHNWENSVLVPPDARAQVATALLGLSEEPQEREPTAKGQRELVHGYSPLDVVTRQHLDVFATMLAGRAQRRD